LLSPGSSGNNGGGSIASASEVNDLRDRLSFIENFVNANPKITDRLDTLERRVQELAVSCIETLESNMYVDSPH